MNITSIEEFYGQSIGVKAPWKVVSVAIKAELKEIHVRLECEKGVLWANPRTEERIQIKDYQERTWRHLDTCEFKTMVSAAVPRVKYKGGGTEMVAVPWAEPGGRFTCRYESRLIEFLLEAGAVKAAARLARVTEDQMDGVMNRAVRRGLDRRKLPQISKIGLDEKAYRLGHNYLTVLNDLDATRVIDVVDGRTQEATEKLLRTLPKSVIKSIEAVALDMWPAYRGAVAAVLPNASEVFDRFHISQHLNNAVNEVRSAEHRDLAAQGDNSLARSKYFWLRSDLDMRTKEAIEFRDLINQDLRTANAWALKENFRHFWACKSWTRAFSFLDKWIHAARDSGLKPMERVANMIDKHAHGLLNYIHHPITNAASEGINSAIQRIKAAAKGISNFACMRNRILFFLGKLELRPT